MRFTLNIKHLVLIVAAFSSAASFAANGTHSAAASGAASGMAGTAVANYTTETEALFRNPALLSTDTKELLKPRLEFSIMAAKHNSQGEASNAATGGTGTLTGTYTGSKDSLNFLPNIAVGMRIIDELSAGLGIIALGGSAIDYTGNASLSEQKSEQLMYRMTPALAYRILPNLSVGAGLIVGYSSLSLNGVSPLGGAQSKRDAKTAWGVGGSFGASYSPVENLLFGAAYVTKTKFGFDGIYDLSSLSATTTGTLNRIEFQEPAELAFGVSYKFTHLVLAFDYRLIGWSSALGYSNLGWKDQSVFALGAQYNCAEWAFRAGVNYGKSPIRDNQGIDGDQTQDFQGVSVSKGGVDIANVSGFTAITEWEFDLGGSYKFSEALSVDMALQYVPSNTVTNSGTFGTGTAPYAVSSKANEWAVVAGVNYQL